MVSNKLKRRVITEITFPVKKVEKDLFDIINRFLFEFYDEESKKDFTGLMEAYFHLSYKIKPEVKYYENYIEIYIKTKKINHTFYIKYEQN
jgi:hypothetical protein